MTGFAFRGANTESNDPGQTDPPKVEIPGIAGRKLLYLFPLLLLLLFPLLFLFLLFPLLLRLLRLLLFLSFYRSYLM